jgi:hypothetical protein
MKFSFTTLLLCLCGLTFAQNEPFSYLQKLEINSEEGIYIKYNTQFTEVFNQSISELSDSDPLRKNYSYEFNDIKLLKTRLQTDSSTEYFVVFSYGPSFDPVFKFYRDDNLSEPAFSIYALKLYITGSAIYSAGHTNNYFNMRRKFVVQQNKLVEVEQPFYYVGLKTKTLKPIKLSDNNGKVVATLTKDYNIEVLMYDAEQKKFLVSTEFGLTGWVFLKDVGTMPYPIDKLFYNGD